MPKINIPKLDAFIRFITLHENPDALSPSTQGEPIAMSSPALRNHFVTLNEIDQDKVKAVIVNQYTIQRIYKSDAGDAYPGHWIVFNNGETIKVADAVENILKVI